MMHRVPQALIVCAALLLVACGNQPEASASQEPAVVPAVQAAVESEQPRPAQRMFMARMHGLQGAAASGRVRLLASATGVQIRGRIRGLEAGATHGFHVHEIGDCSAPDGSSAGPHFNPDGHAHGHPGEGEHHAGDLPNLVADEHGRVRLNLDVAGLTLGDGGTHDIAGRALVLHAHADDYASQPAGDSGARIACGVIASPTRGGD